MPASSPTILIAEDDRAVREALQRALQFEGYAVITAPDGGRALELLAVDEPDAVVLDVMMPGIDGLTVCRRLRDKGITVPVLMLTARHEIADRVAGLDAGADDYLVKPYALDELLARLRALLRRTSVTGNDEASYELADLVVDTAARRVTRAGTVIDLTKTEFDLLELLVHNADIVLTRDVIYERIWGYDFETGSKSLDVYIGYLRRKLEADDAPRLIHTVRGVGYVAGPVDSMSLRARIALLVGITVLIASAIGGIGTAITSRNVGRDRLDQALLADATRFPADVSQLANQLQFAFETRRATCDDDTLDPDEITTDVPRGVARRLRFVPEFASAMQLIRPNGAAVAACQTIPISDDDFAIAADGTGSRFRTVSIEGRRYRVLTSGVGDLGAIQFARDLDLTEATLRGLVVRIIGFGAIGAVLAAAIGWSFAKQATQPVQRLSATADRVARTRDLGERIEVEGDDEIAALATSFNTMLGSLDTSREQQQRLVQDASHELRTPLTSMRTNVELLQRHPSIDDATRAQILADIGAELAELTELTTELVESATEVPTKLAVTTPVDLREVTAECVDRARRRHRHAITLHTPDAASTVVVGDASLLGRAITNLINNAAKFSEPDTPIDVEVRGSSLTVHDRGGGIDDGDLPHIFDRFYRSTNARSAPGSGLGLAIVKQIVEGHGGSVHASNRFDGGATIGFTLPVGRDAELD